jgi:hypothetical protein
VTPRRRRGATAKIQKIQGGGEDRLISELGGGDAGRRRASPPDHRRLREEERAV